MAPESIMQHKYSKSSDVWSFGVLAWEVVTNGELPYREMSLPMVIVALCNNTAQLQIPPDTPPVLLHVIQLCMQIEEVKRPPFTALAKILSQGNTSVKDIQYL
jgi:serine/threonine protein kinase